MSHTITGAEVPQTSTNGKYVLRSLLIGQVGAVSCIAAHPLGTHIASGGKSGDVCGSRQLKEREYRPRRDQNMGLTEGEAFELASASWRPRRDNSSGLDDQA